MVDRHAEQPPLGGRYSWVVVAALLGLAPYIVLTTASPLLQQVVAAGTHVTMVQGQLAEALSNAGYAFGAVLASWLVQHYRQRMLFLLTEAGFVVGAVLAALAHDPAMFMSGRIIQGAATGLMLVIALPPLITRFPATRMGVTAGVVNLGLFGAVTAGPLLGGIAATATGWRWLYAAVAGLGLVGIAVAALCLERYPPFDPDREADVPGFGLALAATVLPFFGVAHLVSVGFADPIVWVPVAVGLAMLVTLIVLQRKRSDALMPIGPMLHALPVCGLFVAMVAGAVVVAAFDLVVSLLVDVQHSSPTATGGMYWPAVVGVAVTALLFGRLVATRAVPLLVLGGMVALIGATFLLTANTSHGALLIGLGLLGAGAGATVSPGLFSAAWSVESQLVGRVFALVELLRAEAAYLVGPVLLHLMTTHGGSSPDPRAGFHVAMWLDCALAVAGTVAVVAWYVSSGVRPTRPDLQGWLDGETKAIDSPRSVELLRS
jgi:MFS family permease